MARVALGTKVGEHAAPAPSDEGRKEVIREGPATHATWPDTLASLFIVAVALFMAWHTWAHWGSIESDCGRELYVPLEILRGKLLYRDIWYDYGPLTPYTQAALIAIFGRHLDVFYGFGVALAIGCAMLLCRIGTILEGRGVGLAAACAMLLAGFGPSTFNYGLPYTYATPLGLFLGLATAWLTIAFLFEGRLQKMAIAGVAAALALLCKPEIGAATYAMLAFAIGAAAIREHSWQAPFRCAAACIPGVALWMGIYGWFLWKVTPRVLLFDNWINTPGTYFARTFAKRAYRFWGLRLDIFNLSIVAASACVALLLWVLIGGTARVRPAARSNLLFAGWCISLVCVAFAARFGASSRSSSALVLAFLVFPAGMVAIALGFLLSRLRAGFKGGFSNRILAETAFTVFALVMSARVLSDVSPYFYGLFYAAPLSLVFLIVIARLLAVLMGDVDATRRRHLIHAALALEVVLIAILVVPASGKRTAPFRTAWGIIYLKPGEAAGARNIFDFAMEQKRKGRAVVFLAELPMMYAFTGTEAPSMWYSVVPGYVPPDKEKNYILDLEKAEPEYVLITNRSYSEYGVPYFGLDYDRRIYRWVERNYRVVGQLGDFRRVKDAPLAALIYERRA